MWRSVFLHEFPDEDIRSLQALPGSVSAGTLALNPNAGAVQITPGRGFEYSLTDPLVDIIGVSGTVRVRYPIQGLVFPVPIMRAGNMAELRIQPMLGDPGFNPTNLEAPARALLRIGPMEADLGQIMLPHRRFVDLRFDWYTSGQARLQLNGGLVGYQNALSPGARLTIADIGFGLPDGASTSTNPRYEVGRLFVRALARSDSMAAFSRELPAIHAPVDDLYARCLLLVTVDMMAKLDRLRSFMTNVNQALTQPWSEEAGPAQGAFTPDAILAHDLATAVVVELKRMLRSGDFTTPERFLAPFTQFLEIVHQALPAEFEELAAELGEASAVPEECRAVLENAFAPVEHDLAPLVALFAEASHRIARIAGGE